MKRFLTCSPSREILVQARMSDQISISRRLSHQAFPPGPSGNRRTAMNSLTPTAVVTPLASRDLDDLPGKELLLIAVDYPPGSNDAVHMHHAHALVYVLDGSIVMQVRGGAPTT